MTFNESNVSTIEESKRHDEGDSSYLSSAQRLTTKQKV
jgi:hypothetical protein